MSAQYDATFTNNQIHSKDSKTKQKCYSILQSNHNNLWQNFIISILNHIEHAQLLRIQQNKIIINSSEEQRWLKQQIENILKWFSNPHNRFVQIRYQTSFRKLEKERMQWQATFERLLQEQWQSRSSYEKQIEDLRDKIKELQEYGETINAKNSVLQSVIKSLKSKQGKTFQKQKQNKKQVPCNQKINNLSIENQLLCLEIKPFYNIVNHSSEFLKKEKQKYDSCTMTMEILRQIQQQNSTLSRKLSLDETIYNIKIQHNQKIMKIQHILPIKCQKICSQTSEFQTQTLKHNIDGFTIIPTLSLCYQPQKNQNQQSISSISSCSYILQADHGTQTSSPQHRGIYTQTDDKYDDSISQSVLATLLMKISLLEAQVDSKNNQIANRTEQIERGIEYVDCLKKQMEELRSDIAINGQIEQHLEKVCEQYRVELQDLHDRYKQVVNKLSTLTQCPIPEKQQSQSQTSPWTPQPQNCDQTALKIQQPDEQLLTNESEQQQHQMLNRMPQISQNCSSLSTSASASTLASAVSGYNSNKQEIVKNLIQYMEMEIDDAKFQKKASLLVSVVLMLGVQIKEQQAVLRKYIEKIGGLKKKKECGLQKKLYSYLTDQV